MTKEITALSVQKKNPNRVNVYLDGDFAFGLSRIVAAWLKVGQKLSEEKITELLQGDSIEVALQRALRFLSYRPRSIWEVEKNLRKHETPEEIILEVIEQLQRNGMLDDHKFANLWVENRSTFRPRGAYALRQELRQKGIPRSIIESVLNEIDEESLAYAAGLKKAPKIRSREFDEFRKKLYGFLARRGFGYDVIAPVVNKLWEEKITE